MLSTGESHKSMMTLTSGGLGWFHPGVGSAQVQHGLQSVKEAYNCGALSRMAVAGVGVVKADSARTK